MSNPNEKVLRILNATPEQKAAIDRILAGESVAPKGPEVEPFIDKHELARRLGKSLRAVDGYIAKGIVPHYKWGRSIAFKWSEVEAFMRENCRISRRTNQ